MNLQDDINAAIIDNTITPRMRVRPMYFELGFSDRPDIYVRVGVLKRLMVALEALPAHVGFEVWDVYRPRAVQATLFDWMKAEVKKLHPHFSEDEIFAEARKFASPPSKVGEAYCPPHLSGGAVDLTLFNVESGEVLEMGTPFDDCTPRAHALYFEQHPNLDNTIRESRTLLRHAMLSAGFTLYEYEWWHFDYGTSFWSQSTGNAALYPPLFGDNEWPG